MDAIDQMHCPIGELAFRAARLRLRDKDSAEGPRERQLLTVDFTTGETYFFRDQGQFDLFAAKILPDLIVRRGSERSLRLQSADYASGQAEPPANLPAKHGRRTPHKRCCMGNAP